MKRLHLIRKRGDRLASAAIQSEIRASGVEVAVLLLQDAVLESVEFPVPVYISEPDLKARGVTRPGSLVDYDRIGGLLLEYDQAVVW